MSTHAEIRPIVLSIAGYDPSGCAGILADIKTFEQHQVQGIGVISANTFQNQNDFTGVEWISPDSMKMQLDVLLKHFRPAIVKIGLIENLECLNEIITYLIKKIPSVKIIWDPILKASAGFIFHKSLDKELLKKIVQSSYLITPNTDEFKLLNDSLNNTLLNVGTAILLKGGHADGKEAIDILFEDNKQTEFPTVRIDNEKRGTGCVLSASISAELALGNTLEKTVKKAKNYTLNYIKSNNTKVGYHKL